MKFGGDVPEKHKELMEELKFAEKDLDANPRLPKEYKAKCYVCLAHDWYDMGFEDEGHALLLKADNIYPGYFGDKLGDQMTEDKAFAGLIMNMAPLLADIMMDAMTKQGRI